MAVGDAHVFPGFRTPVLTLLSFKANDYFSNMLLAEVRGENTPKRKFASTGSQTHNHQVMSPTRSPLSYSGGASMERVKGSLKHTLVKMRKWW